MSETPRVRTWCRWSMLAAILPVAGLLPSARRAVGLETIQELDPNGGNNPAAVIKYDRFLNDPSFIGSSFNWSGVGQTASAQWATMISPSFFVSANHYHPSPGDTLYFHYSNNSAGAFETRTVLSGSQIGAGDVFLGQLSAPVSASVAKYPILNVGAGSSYYSANPSQGYPGPVIYSFGLGTGGNGTTAQRLGRNNIDGIHTDEVSLPSGTEMSTDFYFDYDNPGGVGPNESLVQVGDSGGPDFIMVNVNGANMPAVVGTNFFQTEDSNKVVNGSGSVLIPSYLSGIKSAMAAGDEQPTLVGLWQSPNLTVRKGDFNLDGTVGVADIQALVFALNDLNGYESLHGLSDAYTIAMGDFNNDGKLSNADLQGLISYIAGGGMGGLSVVPEPSAAVLLVLGAWPAWRLARGRVRCIRRSIPPTP